MSNEKKTKKDIIITEKDAEKAVKKELKRASSSMSALVEKP